MKRNILIFISSLFSVFPALAQTVEITTNNVAKSVRDNTLTADFDLGIIITDVKANCAVVITPVLSDGIDGKEMPAIIVNGSIKHKSYKRAAELNKRMGIENPYIAEAVFYGKKRTTDVHFTSAVPHEAWMDNAAVTFSWKVLDANDKVMASKNSAAEIRISAKTEDFQKSSLHADAPSVIESHTATEADVKGKLMFKGAYIVPISDERDKRNKQLYNFKIDEARVMADVSPQTLSLYELFAVAQSYITDPKKYYSIIELTARLYPSDPVANMNAAAAAIDQGKTNEVIKYLKIALHDNNQYMNNRGVYEILSGNIAEGVLYLKQAQTAGSSEATKNLTTFFNYYKR